MTQDHGQPRTIDEVLDDMENGGLDTKQPRKYVVKLGGAAGLWLYRVDTKAGDVLAKIWLSDARHYDDMVEATDDAKTVLGQVYLLDLNGFAGECVFDALKAKAL